VRIAGRASLYSVSTLYSVSMPSPTGRSAATRVRSGERPGDSANKDEYVVVLGTPGEVEAVRPDLERIRRLPVSRVLVTAPGGDDADFTSRNFAAVLGLDEDQATGSAHAVLGPLWAGRLARRRLSAVQASVRRGRLAVAVEDDRVHVGGHAITITRGEWVP
jgi:predicted PhzF superfamily epimerase YddE/YHI9